MFWLFVSAVIFMNIYDWWRLRCAFLARFTSTSLVLLFFILFALLSPMFVNRSQSILLRAWCQFCWIWLAWSFWLACSFVFMDVLNLLVGCVSHLLDKDVFIYPMIPDFSKGVIALGLIVVATVWGVAEAYSIKVKHVDVFSGFVPKSGYRIAFISDVHIGSACSWRKLKKIKSILDKQDADLILCGGDLFDGRGEKEESMARMLAMLKTTRKIGVYGNHEVYTGLDYSRRLFDAAGFKLLENQTIDVDGWLRIYGETDPANGRGPQAPLPGDRTFSILLKHRPDPWALGGYNLQLSGHSHGGQIFPFNFLVRMHYPYKEGALRKLPGGTEMYVSNGVGVWGPPFRFMARPEITVFDFSQIGEVR